MMDKPRWFNPEVSIGNLLSAVVVIVGLAIGWQTLAGVTQSNAKDITAVAIRVTALEVSLASILRDINADRLAQTRMLTELQTDMRYTRQAVEDIRTAT